MQKLTLLFVAALLALNADARNKLRPSLKDSLQTAASQLYEKNNINFLFVAAIKDGVLKPDQDYYVQIDSASVRFKGMHVSKRLRKQYQQQVRTVLINKGTPGVTSSFRGQLSLSEIFDTKSSLWKDYSAYTPYESDSDRHLGDYFVLHLLEDNLVDTSANDISLDLSDSVVLVNHLKLEGDFEKKYIALYQNYGGEEKRRGGYTRITMSGHPHKLRYPHPGAATND